MMRKFGGWMLAVAVLLLVPTIALADSITPSSFSATIGVGDSVTVRKTVTVTAGTPTAAQGDVLFLSDTTGSMGSTIASVKASASAILTGLAAFGNIQTGAGSYRDFFVAGQNWGSPGDYAWRLDAAIGGAASTQTGINSWIAGGGNDTPESQLYALSQAVATAGWRAGSEKFIVWFGDAPGHEPSSTPGYPGPSTSGSIAALQAAGVTVLAYNVGFGGLDDFGQATDITSQTGGALFDDLPADPDAVVDTIIAAIGAAFDTYSTVGLDVSGVPPGLDVAVNCTGIPCVGLYDRSVARDFEFDVKFTGTAPGTYGFPIYATVDGGRVATEDDTITVRGGAVPEPSTLLLLGTGVLGLAAARFGRKR